MSSQINSAPIIKPTINGLVTEFSKPRVTTGESRFVPINADPWRSRRGPREIATGYGHRKNGLNYDYKVSMTPFLEADPTTARQTQELFGQETPNSQHFHQYPYPHYHIYYNRRGTSVLNEEDKTHPNHKASKKSHENSEDNNENNDPNTYDSPNSYFEFTNPNESAGGEGGGGDEPTQEEDYDDNDGEGDERDDDSELTASPPERELRRNRRELRQVNNKRYPSTPSPLPSTLSPSSRRPTTGMLRDDGEFGWAVSGPNFFKSGKYHGGDGKNKPRKYSYNYYKRDDPHVTKDPDLDDAPPSHQHRKVQVKQQPKREVISGITEIIHEIPNNNANKNSHQSKKRSPVMNDEDDYTIHYGGGNKEEWGHEYDSDKDKRKNRNHDGNHGGYEENDDGGHGGHYHDGDHGEQGDGQEDEDDY